MEEPSPIEGIFLYTVAANGISHRIAVTRGLFEHHSTTTPTATSLIMFLHGWPESWYSWRHQLLFLKDRPYQACAPDMRGYGSTSQPPLIDDYTVSNVSKDVLDIAKILGYTDFIVVGHDWGASLAWHMAMLYPDNVTAVCGMSVPYCGLGKKGFLTMLQEKFGKCLEGSTREEKEETKFNYILHQNLPRVEEEFDRNAREALFRIYSHKRNMREYIDSTPEFDPRGLMFPSTGDKVKDIDRVLDATDAPGLWLRLPKAKSLPAWLTATEFEYYVSEFKRAGFIGGLRYYQVLDKNWDFMRKAVGINAKVSQPSLFIVGDDDAVLQMYGGKEAVRSRMKACCTNLIHDIFIKGAGHWVQQEKNQEVNEKLIAFLEAITESKRLRSKF